MFHPALTTGASERMKTHWFSYVAGFAARERMREAKPVKARKSGVPPLFRHAERSRAWPLLLSLSKTAMGRLEFKRWEKRSNLKRRVAMALAERGPAKGGRGFPLSSCTGRRGLRGGTIVWRHAVREGGFSTLRRAVCCVGSGPAGRCGYFSFSAYRRRQRKVPRKEARHSYFFERDSVQVHKSCHKEAGTAAFLSASQTPKGKKSRPKERPWLPQARGKRCTGASCVRRTGGRPRARRRAARKAQRAAKPSRCEFCNSPQRPFRSRNTGPPFGGTDRQSPTAQHKLHKPNSHNSPPNLFPTQPKESFFPSATD